MTFSPGQQSPMAEQSFHQPNISSEPSRFVDGVALAAVVTEVNPLTNDALRLGALGAVAAATRDPIISAAVYGAATFAIEGAGVYGVARLMANKRGHNLLVRVKGWAERLRGAPLAKTKNTRSALAVDTALSFVAGPPVMVAMRTAQDPSRGMGANLSYGLKHSAVVSAGLAAETYVAVEGITHPNKVTLGCAALGSLAILGGWRWAKEKVRQPEVASYGLYRKAMDAAAAGPQLEGYASGDYQNVVQDPDTRYIHLRGSRGRKRYAWPALARIEHNTEYMPPYFEERYGERNVYYLSIADLGEIARDRKAAAELGQHISALSQEGAVIVWDEAQGQEKTHILQRLISDHGQEVTFEVDEFVDDRNGTPAASVHFSGVAYREQGEGTDRDGAESFSAKLIWDQYQEMVQRGEMSFDPRNGTFLVDPNAFDKPYRDGSDKILMERLWEIYQQRFDWLIKQSPTRGKQTRAEVEAMVGDPHTLVAAHMVDGEVAAFAMFVNDISTCNWLRSDYYSEQYPGEALLYFPGIASDEAMRGGYYSRNIAALLARVVGSVHGKVRLVWQCTNLSAGYIPRLVSMGISASGVAQMEGVVQTAKYNYRGLVLGTTERG